MPELPEVETVRRGLSDLLEGKKVMSVKSDWHKSFPNDQRLVDNYLIGSKITEVKRRAKVIIINLDSDYCLMIHLKMTGQLVYVGDQRFGAGHPNDSLIAKLPDKSTRVVLTFKDKSSLYFNDQRKFGWMKLLHKSRLNDEPFMKSVGPELIDPDITNTIFVQRLQKRPGSNIKAVLLDQSVIAGVGNIYADESLWAAKIHPTTLVKDLNDTELATLREELINVLKLSIEKGGSTDKNYVDAEGNKGSYLEFAKVFRREGKPCYRCGSVIVKSKVAARGTHTCNVCQIKKKA